MKPYQHQVKYYECDRMGITHHSNYLRFMEEARIDWMDQLGYGYERMEAEGVVSPVVSVSVQYKRPTTFKDVIAISVQVEKLTNAKLGFCYTMTVGDTLVCTAQSLHCFLENNRPVSLLQRFPALYNAIEQTIKGN
ncbi:MAG: acyl-CoA thioesterase [Paludibacteraceae bacterium]|nr:acyl-CoA thioesterase [Paludibacteraceae bacterium]